MIVGFDSTITAVANPVMASSLKATLADLQWITNVYLLALTSTMVIAGRIGDRFGRESAFMLGIAGFGASSVAIGLSASVDAIIVFRALQGLFGSLLLTNAFSLVRNTFPPDRLATGISLLSAVNGVATSAGPIVGGLVVEKFGWEWAFMINGPIALVGLLAGTAVFRGRKIYSEYPSFDFIGTMLLIGTMVPMTWAIIKAPEDGWSAISTLTLLSASVVGLTLFILRESRTRNPLLPLHLFRNQSITAGAVLSILAFFGLVGALFPMTLYLQNVIGLSPLESGTRVVPMSLAVIVAAVIAGPVIDRIGPRPAIVAGMSITAMSLLLLSTMNVVMNGAVLTVSLLLLGLGLGFAITATGQSILGNVPERDAGAAAGIHQTSGRLGSILGTSGLGAILASLSASKFTSMISTANLPPEVARALRDQQLLAAVSVGAPPVPSGIPDRLASVLRESAEAAFVYGMQKTLLIGAVLCAVGALVGLMVQRARAVRIPHDRDPGSACQEAGEPAATSENVSPAGKLLRSIRRRAGS